MSDSIPTFSGESAATAPRLRLLGETIGAGDFIQAGDFRSTAIEMNCVGLIVRGTRIQVLTYDPLPIDIAALAKNAEWPKKPSKPLCSLCHVADAEYDIGEGCRVCRSCFDDLRENGDVLA